MPSLAQNRRARWRARNAGPVRVNWGATLSLVAVCAFWLLLRALF